MLLRQAPSQAKSETFSFLVVVVVVVVVKNVQQNKKDGLRFIKVIPTLYFKMFKIFKFITDDTKI